MSIGNRRKGPFACGGVAGTRWRFAEPDTPFLFIAAVPATADAQVSLGIFNDNLGTGQIVLMSALTGAVIFAVLSTIQLIRARGRVEAENARLRMEVGDLKSFADRAEALVNEEDQRLVAWGAPGEPPLVAGALPPSAGAPSDRAEFLNFSAWLRADSAHRLDQLVARLRDKGEHFQQVVTTRGNRLIEVRGRTVGTSAVARFRDLTGERLARAEIEARHDLLAAEVETTRAMLASAPMPIWLRDEKGVLVWVNAAYAAAVEAKDDVEAVAHGLELLDSQGRPRSSPRTPAIRCSPSVSPRSSPARAASSTSPTSPRKAAAPASPSTSPKSKRRRQRSAARSTSTRARSTSLQTAVAIFGPDRRLKSYNAAYRALFDLDAGFLDSAPEEAAILDRLRAARKLPEQADFRSWRADLFAAYRSVEAREQWWHLPDGQTLRVIANPHPQGGITWVYENVTERLDLESRYNALVRVQGETLDHLAEGVAVFGSDGRLRLHNPSFAAIWGLPRELLADAPHVSEIVAACRRPGDDEADVAALHRLRRRPRRDPRLDLRAAWSGPTAASSTTPPCRCPTARPW